MPLASSKLTSQGQISVPAEMRRKLGLGLGPGSVLEWEEEGDRILVRRAGKHTSRDLHEALFPETKPLPRALADLKEGIRRAVRKHHARG